MPSLPARPSLEELLGTSKNGFKPAPQFQTKPPMTQKDIDNIWGTSTKTSILPQQQVSKPPQQTPGAGDIINGIGKTLFNNPIQQSIVNKHNRETGDNRQLGNPIDTFTEGTLKPMAKFAVAAPTTLYKNAQGFVNDVGTLSSELSKGKGWNDKLSPEGDLAMRQADQQASAPVEVPWLGNVNYNQSDETGGLNVPKSLANAGAGGGEALLGYTNIVNPISSVKGATIRGGLQASAHEIQNKDASIASTATAGVTGAATSAVLQGFMNKLMGNQTWSGAPKDIAKTIEKEATKAGLKPNVVKKLQTMKPEQKILQKEYLDRAFKNLEDPDNAPAPMEKLADDITSGMQKLYRIKQNTGTSIGSQKAGIKEGSPKFIDPSKLDQLKNDFMKDLSTLRAKVNPGDPALEALSPDQQELAKIAMGKDAPVDIDFSKSTIKNVTGDQKMLESAWKEIKNAKTLDDLIAARDTIANDLHFGKANQQISSSENYIKNLMYGRNGKGGIADIIHNENSELGELDSVFHELTTATQAFQKKTGGSIPLTADQAIDGTNTYNLLRKSLGAGTKESRNILTKLQALGEKYGINELKDIMSSRRFAQTAEDIVGTDVMTKPTSFAGRLVQGTKGIKDTLNPMNLPNIAENLGAIRQAIVEQPKQAEVLKKLLKKAPTPTVLKQILTTPAGRFAAEQLKVAGSQNSAKAIAGLLRQALENE